LNRKNVSDIGITINDFSMDKNEKKLHTNTVISARVLDAV
jgi:hypothetical protein